MNEGSVAHELCGSLAEFLLHAARVVQGGPILDATQVLAYRGKIRMEACIQLSVDQVGLAAQVSPSHAGAVACDLARLWGELVSGACHLVESWYANNCHWGTICRSSRPWHEPRRTRVVMLERVLLGESQKLLAFEFGLTVSSVATACAAELRQMGSDSKVSRAPVILVTAAHAARGFGLGSVDATSRAGLRPLETTVRIQCSDSCLRDNLTAAELAVARLQLAGYSLEAIARARSTSLRTVANQVSSVHKKLRITCRAELVVKLLGAHAPASANVVGGTSR